MSGGDEEKVAETPPAEPEKETVTVTEPIPGAEDKAAETPPAAEETSGDE